MPTETDVCNVGLGKIGGAGDQASGTGIIASINGRDRVSARCKLWLPRVRRRVLGDLGKAKAPPREALVFTDLGTETTPTLKMGGWNYAFNLPADTIQVMRQIDEKFVTAKSSITDTVTEYSFQVRWQDTTQILFTNKLSNSDGDSAFVERLFDQIRTGTWNDTLIDAVATLLGSELVATVGAVDKERTRLLAEYKTVCLPTAIAFNQRQDDDFVRTVTDYSGGRSSGAVPILSGDLGTYTDASGNRRSI